MGRHETTAGKDEDDILTNQSNLSEDKFLSSRALQQIRISALFCCLPPENDGCRVYWHRLSMAAIAGEGRRVVPDSNMIVASCRSITGRVMPVHVTGLRVQRADAASQLVRRLLEGLSCCLMQLNRVIQLEPLYAVRIQNHSHSAHGNTIGSCLPIQRHCVP